MNEEELVKNNLNLVYLVIRKLGIFTDIDIHYSEGLIGLLEACRTYDSSKGYTFSSYATLCIKHAIFKQFKSQFTNKRRINYETVSLNEPMFDDDETTLFADCFASDIDIEAEVIENSQKELLYKIIDILDPQDKFIMEHFYGLRGCKEMSQGEIAEALGVKKSYVFYRVKRSRKIIKKIVEGR